jgi:energy-coupling factor transporter ATP-binding protein EcfA2
VIGYAGYLQPNCRQWRKKGIEMKQQLMDLGEPRQNDLMFPTTLAEKYLPRRIQDFIGIEEPKRVVMSLIKRPRPCNLLFVGPAGSGKTTLAMALATALPASLVHVGAQRADVAMIDSLGDRFCYMPAVGKWWLALVDECDQATDKAQLQLLSKMDGTASLKPMWGGGMTCGTPPNVIWCFTSNGNGPDGVAPPKALLPRFQSRCMILPFYAVAQADVARYLKKMWKREKGREGLPDEYFYDLAQGVGVRDALMRLDVELLRNPTVREVKKVLADKKAKAEANQWTAAVKAVESVA